MRFQLRDGRIALLIGLVFLFLCTSLGGLAHALALGTISLFAEEGLLILGWVAMWRPLQIFLYDWWPIRHNCRLYAKLSMIPVELRAEDGWAPPAPAPGPCPS